MSCASSLTAVVPFLETLLDVAGHGCGAAVSGDTRESLRVRFRKATRLLLERRKAEVESEQAALSVRFASNHEGSSSLLLDCLKLLADAARQQPPALDNVFTESPPPAKYEVLIVGFFGSHKVDARNNP